MAVVKCRLYQLSLLLPKLAVAKKETLAGNRMECPFEQRGLVELLGLFDQDLPDQVRVIQLVDMERSEVEVGDVSEVACNPECERRRIGRKPARQHLRQNRA